MEAHDVFDASEEELLLESARLQQLLGLGASTKAVRVLQLIKQELTERGCTGAVLSQLAVAGKAKCPAVSGNGDALLASQAAVANPLQQPASAQQHGLQAGGSQQVTTLAGTAVLLTGVAHSDASRTAPAPTRRADQSATAGTAAAQELPMLQRQSQLETGCTAATGSSAASGPLLAVLTGPSDSAPAAVLAIPGDAAVSAASEQQSEVSEGLAVDTAGQDACAEPKEPTAPAPSAVEAARAAFMAERRQLAKANKARVADGWGFVPRAKKPERPLQVAPQAVPPLSRQASSSSLGRTGQRCTSEERAAASLPAVAQGSVPVDSMVSDSAAGQRAEVSQRAPAGPSRGGIPAAASHSICPGAAGATSGITLQGVHVPGQPPAGPASLQKENQPGLLGATRALVLAVGKSSGKADASAQLSIHAHAAGSLQDQQAGCRPQTPCHSSVELTSPTRRCGQPASPTGTAAHAPAQVQESASTAAATEAGQLTSCTEEAAVDAAAGGCQTHRTSWSSSHSMHSGEGRSRPTSTNGAPDDAPLYAAFQAYGRRSDRLTDWGLGDDDRLCGWGDGPDADAAYDRVSQPALPVACPASPAQRREGPGVRAAVEFLPSSGSSTSTVAGGDGATGSGSSAHCHSSWHRAADSGPAGCWPVRPSSLAQLFPSLLPERISQSGSPLRHTPRASVAAGPEALALFRDLEQRCRLWLTRRTSASHLADGSAAAQQHSQQDLRYLCIANRQTHPEVHQLLCAAMREVGGWEEDPDEDPGAATPRRSASAGRSRPSGHPATQAAGASRAHLWDVHWSWASDGVGVPLSSLLTWQRVNHYPGARALTRKDLLARHLARAAGSAGARASATYDIMPTTFVLPREFSRFVDAFTAAAQSGSSSSDNIWLVKPIGLSRGRGLELVNDVHAVTCGQPAVVQLYVSRPLLVDGYKFDLRLYVLVTSFSPLEAWLYTSGFARFATQRYSVDPEHLRTPLVHLTNSAIQRARPPGAALPLFLQECGAHLDGDSKCSLDRLWELLAARGTSRIEVWPRLARACLAALGAAGEAIPHHPNAFELFGFDLLLDENLQVWLLEVNASPSLAAETELDRVVKAALLGDTLRLLAPPVVDREALLKAAAAAAKGGRSSLRDGRQAEVHVAAMFKGEAARPVGLLPSHLGGYEQLAPSPLADAMANHRRQQRHT